MKRLASLIALCLMGCGAAEDNELKPALELTGRVVDRADLLDDATETMLTARLARLERETGAQMVVATTPSLGGREIDEYSLDLARAWRIGSKERNDGLLLLVAPKERRVRIEVGKGLEKVMKNEVAARIIRAKMVPLFKQGQMQAGILSGTGTILDVMRACVRTDKPFEEAA